MPTGGVLFSDGGPPDVTPIFGMAESAEEMGYHAVWVGDGIAAKPRLEALTMLGALAARTHRVRIGTAELYAQVEQIPEVVEALAIGQDWDNDVRIVLFVRLRKGTTLDEPLRQRIKARIRAGASPRHVPGRGARAATSGCSATSTGGPYPFDRPLRDRRPAAPVRAGGRCRSRRGRHGR